VPRFVSCCLLVTLAGCAAVPLASERPPPDLAAQPALAALIDPANFDRALMTAAIFQETNRARERLGLPRFHKLEKLDAAADLEAAVGKFNQPPSHENPFPQIGTPAERVKYVGLAARRVAENIALLSIYAVDSGVGVGVTQRGGHRVFVHPLTGAELKPATYAGFATEVVKAWMRSPGHRANIIEPELVYLGCSVQPSVNILGIESLFCVQVFFTPHDRREAAAVQAGQ
jgi:uncharacterized protein YkwD